MIASLSISKCLLIIHILPNNFPNPNPFRHISPPHYAYTISHKILFTKDGGKHDPLRGLIIFGQFYYEQLCAVDCEQDFTPKTEIPLAFIRQRCDVSILYFAAYNRATALS